MTTILRIEDKSGWGVFRTKRAQNISNSDEFYEKHYSFPTPREDSGIKRFVNDDEFCAFKSIEQFQKWFTKDETRQFIKLGFSVLLIDVSECLIGDFQILYKKEHIVNSKDITELFI